MRSKKTLSNWLVTRYQLIIRNEENFAEKTSFGFTYAKVILFSLLLFTVIFGISLFLSKTVLARWYDPRHAQMVMDQKLFELAQKVDSLNIEVDRKEQFILNIQRVLSGDTSQLVDPSGVLLSAERRFLNEANLSLTPADSQFRRDFENSDLSLITVASMKYRELQETFFYSPLAGYKSDGFDNKGGHFGIDIVSKPNEPVKTIADGTVIFADWTQETGYVIMIQHSANLVSVYKHNAQLLKKVGSFVNAGDIISIVGNSGEMTDGPHLHFELWYNMAPLNPEEFITF